jgi:serine phosphatase RsbU (regulator of sigma subunit)
VTPAPLPEDERATPPQRLARAVAWSAAVELLSAEGGRVDARALLAAWPRVVVDQVKLRSAAVWSLDADGEAIELVAHAGTCPPSRPERHVDPAVCQALAAEPHGLCNGEEGSRLGEGLGLRRFLWATLEWTARAKIVVAAGYGEATFRSHLRFEREELGFFRMSARMLEALLGHLGSIGELEHRVGERTRELSRAYEELTSAFHDLEQRDRAIRLDLEGAREFQRSALAAVPQAPGLAIDAYYRPVDAVGGDLYDIEPLEGGGVRVLIADATGHGVRAALATMCIKGEYEIAKRRGDTPASVLRILNERTVQRHGRAGMHFTALCVDVDVRRDSIRYASAAHPAPCLLSRGRARCLDTGGAYVGFVSGVDYPEWEAPFAPGDAVYVFTDGLLDQPDRDGEMFGERRLVEALLEAQRAGVAPGAYLLDRLASLASPPASQYDDMTLVGVERRA